MKNNTLPSIETYAKVKELEEQAAQLKARALELKTKAIAERKALLESFVALSECENVSALILELRALAREKDSDSSNGHSTGHTGRPGIPEDVKGQVKNLLIVNKSPKEVAKKTGLSIASVYNIRRELPRFAHAA